MMFFKSQSAKIVSMLTRLLPVCLIAVRVVMTLLAATVMESAGSCQEASRTSLPSVYAAAVPIYPPVAQMANVQGVVRVRVATDGHTVVSTSVENQDANPVLARAAEENAQTWKFSAGEPVTFTVTYRYVLVTKLRDIRSNAGNSKVVIRFPTDVQVSARRWPDGSDVHVHIKSD